MAHGTREITRVDALTGTRAQAGLEIGRATARFLQEKETADVGQAHDLFDLGN